MTFGFRSGLRRTAVALAALTVVAGLALAAPASAVQDTKTSRLSGNTRYSTAAAAALDAHPTGAATVVLATGENFADALAANGLAGAFDAPLLLTESNKLTADTGTALDTLAPTTVYVMGGTKAVSQAVEDVLVEGGYTVKRLAGENRFATAALAADEIAASTNGVGSTGNGLTAILTNAFSFADAVSGGPIAYAGRLPVLLTEKSDLPKETTDALAKLGIKHIIVLGGTAAVSDSVRTQLENAGYTTQRIAGASRYATNTKAAEYAQDEFDFGGPLAVLVTGESFADALAGGTYGGKKKAVLILTPTAKLGDDAKAFFTTFASVYDNIVAIGGTGAVSKDALDAAAAATKLKSNQSLDVSPADASARPPSGAGTPAGDNSDGARTYTVRGLNAGATYTIALLEPKVVDVEKSTLDAYTLTDGPNTSIEGINGTKSNAAGGSSQRVQATGVAKEDGSMTFTIDATAHDAVIPVIYQDANDDGVLNTKDKIPTEPFGLGGRTSWIPAEAADGVYDGSPSDPTDGLDEQTTTSFDLDANFFVAGAGTFYYSSGDVFQIAVPNVTRVITMAEFEGLLSAQDKIQPEYFSGSQSLFKVTFDGLPDIANVKAASSSVAPGGDAVTVTWTPTQQSDAEYSVYRDTNRNGKLDSGIDPLLGTTTQSKFAFTETAGGTTQYIVEPRGGLSKQVDTKDKSAAATALTGPDYFFSNEIVVGNGFIGLTNGSAVATNAGISTANQGDVWMLHFSKDVKIAGNASITVGGNTYVNGTNRSTWETAGSTITITLGAGANSVGFSYPGTITAISGITDMGGTTINVNGLRDKSLEHNGPELMLESSTCNTGDSSCTLVFNEPVSAEGGDASNYSYSPGAPNSLEEVTVGADNRTITLSFSDGLGAGDTIRPDTDSPLRDVDGSTQPAFDFVL